MPKILPVLFLFFCCAFSNYPQQKSTSRWLDLNGNLVQQYSYTERNHGLCSYLPLISFFLSRNYKNHEIIITSNNAGVLDAQSFHSIITLESEAMCNQIIFSCIKKVSTKD